MVNRIMAFGDSVMYGTELPYDDDDIRPLVDSIIRGLGLDETGALHHGDITPALVDAKEEMEKGIEDYDERCKRYSMSGYLAAKLGVPSVNHSFGGYGNDAIVSEILMHRHEFNQRTFVIVGLTYHSRRTRLDETNVNGRIVSINNYAASNRDQIKYLELEDMYGDDLLVRYLHVRNHVSALREILKGVPYLIIDPLNTYRENHELGSGIHGWGHRDCVSAAILQQHGRITKPSLVEEIQKYFNDNTFGYTLNNAMMEVSAEGTRCRQPFLHPTKAVHERFVDAYIIPWMKEHVFA